MTDESAASEAERHNAEHLPLLAALGWIPFVTRGAWLLDHLDEVESDLSAFHRIDDYRTMDSATFFARAWHLGAYAGAVQSAQLAEQEAARKTPHHSTGGTRAPAVGKSETAAFAELEAAGLLEREVV